MLALSADSPRVQLRSCLVVFVPQREHWPPFATPLKRAECFNARFVPMASQGLRWMGYPPTPVIAFETGEPSSASLCLVSTLPFH